MHHQFSQSSSSTHKFKTKMYIYVVEIQAKSRDDNIKNKNFKQLTKLLQITWPNSILFNNKKLTYIPTTNTLLKQVLFFLTERSTWKRKKKLKH